MVKPRQAVQRMQAYHPPLSGRDGLRLDFNENTVACSPRVVEALTRVAASDLSKYPERAHVEAKVAQHLNLKPEQVLLTNGVDEAIHVLCFEDDVLMIFVVVQVVLFIINYKFRDAVGNRVLIRRRPHTERPERWMTDKRSPHDLAERF